MELKVWVEGMIRVVCGLSPNTSCQDVVIALAQAIGQTGRYVLSLKLGGTERQLVASDCPLQQLAQLGQLAADVQFILRRTGPSQSAGPDTREWRLPLPRPSEPEPLKRREPHKAFTFSLGPSALPWKTKPSRVWSPSPRASPEPQASPNSLLDPLYPMQAFSSSSSFSSSKEEVFRQILQQQRRLQELEVQLEALERETEVWVRETSPAAGPSLTVVPEGELVELEQQLRQNKAELMHWEHWEEQLEAEVDRERDIHRRLHHIHSSMDDHSCQIQELQARSARLQQDLKLAAHRRWSQAETPQSDEVLRPLKVELQQRLQQAEELNVTLSETQRELHAAEERLQVRWEQVEELNKELRQCQLQHFIQQSSSSPHTDLVPDVYLSNAGIMEQPSHCTSHNSDSYRSVLSLRTGRTTEPTVSAPTGALGSD